MATNSYHFTTHWRLPATIQEVSDILSDAPDLTRWWPSVYLRVTELEPGDGDGIGKVVDLYTKGWLPYTLRWQFRVTQANLPHSFAIEAWGDFVGTGVWTLEQDGDEAVVTYDWDIQAEKWLLKTFSFAFKPFFRRNHEWAMRKGEQSIQLELQRRHAANEVERAAVPAPEGAAHVPLRRIAGVGAAVGAAAVAMLAVVRRRPRRA